MWQQRVQWLVGGICVVALAAGCASSGDEQNVEPVSGAPSGPPNVITREQVDYLVGYRTAYELVRVLKPTWLRQRSTRVDPVRVYLDGMRLGNVRELSNISVESVQEIRYMSGPDATTRFGTGHSGGAIVVISRRS
jgi:hypothetical protein